ncbi:uncharacterized protein TNCV_4853731 [Trichonephila clavipes]|nr:uncharacterized protein TNCV_4853731 [Trichonephila clavipes]
MDEQLKALLEGINALKSGQEELKNTLEEKNNNMKKKIENVNELFDERMEEMSQRVKDIEKKLLAFGETKNENKFVLASPVPYMPPQFNRWTEGVKACQLVASLRGEAAEVLQTLTDTELLNLNSLYNALDLRFGQKFSKDYARLQMKTRHQKPEESLQEYVFEIQRLTTLAFSDFSANVREMISLKYFVDGLMDEEIQMAVRMADVKDPKYALLYALKVEAATQASWIDCHSIREDRKTLDAPCESPWKSDIEKLRDEFQALMAQRQNRRRRSITCWGCGESGHLRTIIEFKESSDEKPSWQDIAPFHPTTKCYWSLWDSLHLRNGVLYRKWESDDGKTFRWQLILPKTRVSAVLKELHDSPTGGHFGVMKTLQKVRECFYRNNVRSDVKSVVAYVIPVLHAKVPENALEEDCSSRMWERLSNE